MKNQSSFTVGYRYYIPNRGVTLHIVCGVTAIIPEPRGIMMHTENGTEHLVKLDPEDREGLLMSFVDPFDADIYLEEGEDDVPSVKFDYRVR